MAAPFYPAYGSKAAVCRTAWRYAMLLLLQSLYKYKYKFNTTQQRVHKEGETRFTGFDYSYKYRVQSIYCE